MAVFSNIEVRAHDKLSEMRIPVGSSTVIASGDLIDYSTADTAAIVHYGANAAFLGVALEGSESGSANSIDVATRAKVYVEVATGSTTALVGDAFTYLEGANGTDWKFTEGYNDDGVMWALETVTAGNSGLFLIDSHQLTSGFLFKCVTTGI